MGKFDIHSITDSEENPTDRQERISWWDQDKLKNAKIMVVGAGAIGNETLKNLALIGVGHIFVVDFDTIGTSNLSRTVLFRKGDVGEKKAEVAAKRLKEMAFHDDTRIDWFHGDLVWELGTGIYSEMDLVLGCLDNVEARMSINRQCWLTNTPWIDSGTYELGMRVEFYRPPELPCYQCNLTSQQLINANRRYSCDHVKLKAYQENKMPTTQITSAIVSAIQVQEAIKFLCGQPVASGKKIYYQGLNNEFDVFTKTANEACFAHATYPEVVDIDLGVDITLGDFLTYISKKEFSGQNASLDFRGDRTFIKAVACRICGTEIKLMRPTFRINVEEFICQSCQDAGKLYGDTDQEEQTKKITQEVFNIKNTDREVLDLTLHEVGVPYMPILAIKDRLDNYKYYRLKDNAYINSIH